MHYEIKTPSKFWTEQGRHNGRKQDQLLSFSLRPGSVSGLCCQGRSWIPFVHCWIVKEEQVCLNRADLPTENENGRERSFILSVPLHQNSNHIALISDASILLCFYYPLPFLSLSHLFPLFSKKKKKPSPLHCQLALLCLHPTSSKEQLVAPCRKKECLH